MVTGTSDGAVAVYNLLTGEVLERLSHLRRQQDGQLPCDGDLETTARAVTGLVEVYRLEAGDLLEGI